MPRMPAKTRPPAPATPHVPGSKSIVWLASYPKSGNTWLRAFLANYFVDSAEPVSINVMQRISFGDASRASYADLAGGNPDFLPPQALVQLRTAHLGRIAGGAPLNLVKTHCLNGRLGGGALIPPALTKAAIYLVRDPLDMLASYADHWGIPAETAAAQIASDKNMIGASPKTVPQYLGNWSKHVKSWARAREFSTLVLRYEDMLEAPAACFEKALRQMGAPVDREVIAQAVAASSFESLSRQEAEAGFVEKGPAQARFFRAGTSGQGRATLPAEVIERVVRDHGPTMKQFGYL